MGCGAVCGNSASIYQPNTYSQKIVLQLLPQLNHAKEYIAPQQYDSFLKQIKQNPLKYRLKLTSKLIPKEEIDSSILTKWKVILYCLETANPDFSNCLKYKFSKKIIKPPDMPLNDELTAEIDSPQDQYVMQEDSLIYEHNQFAQIEKDIDRTCELSQNKKKTFQRILKRLTNYFPQMGYTQGINFIIGYLLTVGFEEFDAFWMFVHIAIHRRYLQLGLLQDKFPLSQVYNLIFRNLLKRVDSHLYQHLYEQLHMDESVWVFKWFITCFIYSFPIEMIKYVIDLVIQIGGIGLIKFAIAITQELSHILIQEHDVCQISLFFQSLRSVDTFNQHLSINKVVERAYTLQITNQDFAGIQQFKGNFYSDYVIANLQMQAVSNGSQVGLMKVEQPSDTKNKKKPAPAQTQTSNQNPTINRLLKNWYEKLVVERQNFINQKEKLGQSSENKKPLESQLQNRLYLLVNEVGEHQQKQQIKSPQKDNSVSDNKNSVKGSIDVKKQSVPSTGCSFIKKGSGIFNRGDVSEIDELWDEEDKNSSISKNMNSQISQQSRTQNGFNPNARKVFFEEELDKLASTHCNPLGKSKPNFHTSKTSSIFNEQKFASIKPKFNNFQSPSQRHTSKGSNLVKMGQQILTNISIKQHSQNESCNSEYSKFSQKQKRSKQNDLFTKKNYRKPKSKKQISFDGKQCSQSNKIQESDHKSNDLPDHNSSSRGSYMDPQNSFYTTHQFIQDDLKNIEQKDASSVKAFESYRERNNTHQDVLTISLHASHLDEGHCKQVVESRVSQIQIFQAPKVFKKKNRVSSRISGVQNEIYPQGLKMVKMSHTISDADIKLKGQKIAPKAIKMGIEESSINYEQSYESIFVPSEGKNSNQLQFKQQSQKCEIESVM